MKYLFLTLSVLLSFSLFAQTLALEGVMPLENGRVVYTGVVAVDGVNKDELFSRAKRWVSSTYQSANDVIQLSDKEAGSLIVKGNLSTPWKFNMTATWSGYLSHTLTIDMKDGRYRYQLNELVVHPVQPVGASMRGRSDFPIEEFVNRPMQKKSSLNYCVDADLKIKKMLSNLEQAMKTAKSDF